MYAKIHGIYVKIYCYFYCRKKIKIFYKYYLRKTTKAAKIFNVLVAQYSLVKHFYLNFKKIFLK